MKKLAVLCAAAIMAFGAQAQTTKGTVALTGSFGYTQQKADSDKKNANNFYTLNDYEYTILPTLGVFVRDNLEVGATVYLNRKESESYSSNTYYVGERIEKDTRKGYRIYATQYKFLTERFAMHGSLSAGMERTEHKLDYTNSNKEYVYQARNQHNKSSNFSIALSPGLTFFASDKVGVSVNLGALRYSSYDTEEVTFSSLYHNEPEHKETSYTSNTLAVNLSSMYFNFGLTYLLGK